MKHLYLPILMLFSFYNHAQTIGIQQFATGFTDPVEIGNAGDTRLFVVQQGGNIRIVNPDGTIKPTAFLTLTSGTISTGGERGLLGLAFHPDYAENGYFYVNYTNTGGNTVIARYSVSAGNPDLADPSSAVVLLTIPQPFSNHNGGTLRFGPDGYLYIGMGDGGSEGDPDGNGQNKNILLGKMLRIDVDNGTPYGIPPTNPYVGVDGADEIWAVGMRNPWKYSFDSETGDIWIADVGQSSVEEINHESSAAAGLNYGWKCYEGPTVYTAGCAVAGTTYTMPLAQYTHAATGGCSITGGYVYRGAAYPNFEGKFFFADYCVNRIGMVTPAGVITYSAVFPGDSYYTTFGLDMNKELYIAASATGKIYKVIDTSLGINDIAKPSFSLLPNPAKDRFSVTTDNRNFPLTVAVFDLAGERLIDGKIDGNSGYMNVGMLQSGLYIVNIEDSSGARSSSKLMIE